MVYDQEHDVCSPFVWWREDVGELRAGWRWPRWPETSDFGSYLTGVIQNQMRKDYERLALNWQDYAPTLRPGPWWRWRVLWGRLSTAAKARGGAWT